MKNIGSILVRGFPRQVVMTDGRPVEYMAPGQVEEQKDPLH